MLAYLSESFQDVGVTLPVDGSKGYPYIKRFKLEGVAVGDWAVFLVKIPLSEYTWQCESFRDIFTEYSGLDDAEERQPPPVGGAVLEWGPVV